MVEPLPEPLPEVSSWPVIVYDEVGNVSRWGYPNSTALQEYILMELDPMAGQVIRSSRIKTVFAWRVCHVKVWIRNHERDTFCAYVSHWEPFCNYVVERWSEVWTHFDEYFNSGGVANRFQWEVESWFWTLDKGWEPEDWM